MRTIIDSKTNGGSSTIDDEKSFISIGHDFLKDTQTIWKNKECMSIPITELATLGAGVSSLIPALNTVTHTTTIAADGLYRLANKGVGDVLKQTKNGNFYGAYKAADGTSKMAQLTAADPISVTTQSIAAFNPATMMMAVALFSVEKELEKIEDMQKQILSFLEIEQESQIEADVESLMRIIHNYKENWDNEHFVSGNYNQILTYKNRARKNMITYQKRVREIIETKPLILAQANIDNAFTDLVKKFKYYRLSLYIFSLSSFWEIMLSGNFKESYIVGIKAEIQKMTETYYDIFEKSSQYLERLGSVALEANILKGAGMAGMAFGRIIGRVPLAKESSVERFLQDKSEHLKDHGFGMEMAAVHRFATIRNPGTSVIMKKMDDIIKIYNHTEQICFDKERIYLMTE